MQAVLLLLLPAASCSHVVWLAFLQRACCRDASQVPGEHTLTLLCLILTLHRLPHSYACPCRTCRGPRHAPARLRLVLGAAGSALIQGLMNQHLALLNFLTLGIVVGADELVVTASRSRSNFSANASWESRDISELWNTTRMASFLAGGPPSLQCAVHHM